MRKFISFTIIIVIIQTVLIGCAKNTEQPSSSPTPTLSATISPKITHPEGRVIESNPPGVEGMVTELTDKNIKVKVLDEIWSFSLSENAVREIGIFNKDENNKRIVSGTFVIVNYEEKDTEKVAQKIEILISN